MRTCLPPRLKHNDTIGLITPSSPMQAGRLDLGVHYFEQQGFKTRVGRYVHEANRFLAGTDIRRAEDIMDFFMDDEIKAIVAICGGYGSQRLLPLLDLNFIHSHPKWLTGFSDTTALQLGLLSQTGLISCSGFTFRDLVGHPPDPLIQQGLMACLFAENYHVEGAYPIRPGIVKGPLIGGNLSCMNILLGTPFQPNFEQAILLIEDVWAEPYRIDSMLSQLELAGVFQKISGLIWGQFEQCDAHQQPIRDGTIEDIILEWSQRISVPSVKEFPYGHRDRRCVLPLGQEVILDAEKGILSILFH